MEGILGLASNLGNVFTSYHLMILLIGTFGGIILGALPGVSPTLAVALTVPFTFYMEPASGLILLGAIYTSSVAGGAISAILINVPGAPANIATLIDGYPMAKSGKAESALYTCFISSFIGGVVGMVIMVLLTAPLAEFALKFKSAEIFWISVLGLTVVAGLGKPGAMMKSLIAGAFGVWLSTIGPNPVTGEFRFIFHDILTGGVEIIPVLIGLFAVPQVLSLIESKAQRQSAFTFRRGRGVLWDTCVRTVSMFKVQTLGSIIGSIIGLIPGVGGQVAGIVSYDQVKKFSRHPEKFGTGIPEGIAAAESANNAMVGPSLVPLLTLSIPGSPTAAVLLGGLLIHGIFPGPDLFRLHASVVHTFIGSLVLAQLAMLILGILIARYSNWVMRVPDLYMAASIVVLAVFGTFCVNSSFNDVIIMFIIGTVMYLGNRSGFSSLPVVMGFILGGIAENSFLKGLMLSGGGMDTIKYFTAGSINIVVIILCMVSIIYGVYSSRKIARERTTARKSNMFVSAALLLTSITIYSSLDVVDPMSAYVPVAMLVVIGGLAILLFILSLVSLKSKAAEDPAKPDTISIWRLVLFAAVVVWYAAILYPLGFYFSSFIFYLSVSCGIVFMEENIFRRVLRGVFISFLFVGCLYVLFHIILKVQTPTGLFI